MQRNVIRGMVASLTLMFAMAQTAGAQDRKWFDSPDEAAGVAARSGKMIVVSVGADYVDAEKMALLLEKIRIADSQRSTQTPPLR